MIQKPYAAFGYVLIENIYVDNETYFAVIGTDIKCTMLWTKGSFKNRNVTENAPFRDFPTGTFLRPEDCIPGTFEHTAVGETKLVCYDSRLNQDKSLDLVPFILEGGAETMLPVNTKLFLCEGTLAIAGGNIDKPTQLVVRSGDTLVTAVTDCYGLIFP